MEKLVSVWRETNVHLGTFEATWTKNFWKLSLENLKKLFILIAQKLKDFKKISLKKILKSHFADER